MKCRRIWIVMASLALALVAVTAVYGKGHEKLAEKEIQF